MFELMIDGTDTRLALQRAKDTLDLRQLHIARPQLRRIFAGEIAAQQIMAVALFGRFQLGLVDLKREGLACHLLILGGQLNLHEPERPAGFFLAAPIRNSNWSRLGKLLRIARSLRNKRTNRLRRIAISFACRPSLLAST